MIEAIRHNGFFISECSLGGETRADGFTAGQANGIQVARDRFMIVYATRGFRGSDDDPSIVCQLRADGYGGRVLRERILARSPSGWNPFGDEKVYVKQHGHPVAFGVPRGALVSGKPAANSNCFVVCWFSVAREFLPDKGYLLHWRSRPDLPARTMTVEWAQLRLNDDGDDVETVRPPQPLRQVGFDAGPRFCERDFAWMSEALASPVPLNEACTQWGTVNHFDGGRLAALCFRFSESKGIYEWVRTGPPFGERLAEASLVPWRDGWVVAARNLFDNYVAWARADDFLDKAPELVFTREPTSQAPRTVYRCADGVVRIFTTDLRAPAAELKGARNPLHCLDIDPDSGFRASNRRILFDTVAAGLPVPLEKSPLVDMCTLAPHAGGREQVFMHRVRTAGLFNNDPVRGHTPMTPECFNATGIYWGVLRYDGDQPPTWRFAE